METETKLCRENIIDEVCTCGHLKSIHKPSDAGLRYGVVIEGHGSCECGCPQFTWKDFITHNGV